MLIYMQKPDATLVAGYNKWKDLNRAKHGDLDFFFLCDDLSVFIQNRSLGIRVCSPMGGLSVIICRRAFIAMTCAVLTTTPESRSV